MQLKRNVPRVKEVYLRSDNAGCYHCAPLILSLPALGKRIGLCIKEYNFSEAQAGKDLCDRKIAPMKAHINQYVNEGNDVTSAQDMWKALDTHGGVRGCYPSVVILNEAAMTCNVRWNGITMYSNFVFHENKIEAWKAYKIGKSQVFSMSSLVKRGEAQGRTNATVRPYSTPRLTTGVICKHKSDSETEIPCTDISCVKVFRTHEELTNHLSYGKHDFQPVKDTKMDLAARKWARKFIEVTATSGIISLQRPLVAKGYSGELLQRQVTAGWALRQSKPVRRFPEAVKNFLFDEFMRGVDTGKKESPANVANKMRTYFGKEDWLTSRQIANFFSRLAARQKSGRPLIRSENIDIHENDEEIAAIENVRKRSLRSTVKRKCEI